MTDIKKEILQEAGSIVDGARRAAYGKPEDNFERIARFWQAYFENTGRPEANVTAADVSPLMRLMKEARICESPDHRDSHVDLIGYTLTGAEINLSAEEEYHIWELKDGWVVREISNFLSGYDGDGYLNVSVNFNKLTGRKYVALRHVDNSEAENRRGRRVWSWNGRDASDFPADALFGRV